MIEAPCLICGARSPERVIVQTLEDRYLSLIDPALNERNPERAIVRCDHCGFLYHAPTLEPAEIAIMYERYRDASFRDETPDHYFDRITSLPPARSQLLSSTRGPIGRKQHRARPTQDAGGATGRGAGDDGLGDRAPAHAPPSRAPDGIRGTDRIGVAEVALSR